MIIEQTNKEVIIRLPANIDTSYLKEMVDYIRFREITSKSQATQNQVDSLVKEVNRPVANNGVSDVMPDSDPASGSITFWRLIPIPEQAPGYWTLKQGKKRRWKKTKKRWLGKWDKSLRQPMLLVD